MGESDTHQHVGVRTGFVAEPDPDNPGWLTWTLRDQSRFNGQVMGKMIVRSEGDALARVRMFPEHRHTNLADNLHGGVILSMIDISIFAGARMFGLIDAGGAVTLDMNTQFIGAGKAGVPLDCEVELLRETGRLLFLRGLVVQGEARIAAYAATIRKASAR